MPRVGSQKHLPFYLIAAALLMGLTLPVLIQDGMFMDAMLYTSVSHNLSQSIGTFWFPLFNPNGDAGLPSFHEQPPLVFGIQALFFKLLGSSMYTERLYTFVTMCATVCLIVVLWRLVFPDDIEAKRTVWLPLIFWIVIPVCFWSYQNNMHENTMGIFTLASVILFYKSFTQPRSNRNALVAGTLVSLAVLSKGLPGLFPLSAPFLYWLITKEITSAKALRLTMVALFAVIVFYGVLLLFPDSRESLKMHFIDRALFRINQNPTVDSRFYILGRLLMELLIPLAITLPLLLIAKRKNLLPGNKHFRFSMFFISLGLAGSAPLMLTMVQKGFYFVPSLPVFAIGLSILCVRVVKELISGISITTRGILTGIGTGLVATSLSLTVYNIGGISRNRGILEDVSVIATVVPSHTISGINPEAWDAWDLQCYLMRYHNIALSTAPHYEYFIVDKQTHGTAPAGYSKVELPTQRFALYKR